LRLLLILAALAGTAWAFDPVLAWTFARFMGINACYSYVARNVPVLDLAFVETADRYFLVLYERPSARQRCCGAPREPLSAHSSPYTMEAGREDERHAVS
jgi:hypothetical protein